jgi:branched-chain amino acid transport system substrate-binding protein
MKLDDMYVKNGTVRPDGTMVHDMYLMQVKEPGQVKQEWDLLNIVQTIPGEQAWTTKAETKCSLWK